MHWIHLTDEDQLQKIIVRSQEKPQVIFKYDTHCFLSESIFRELQKNCCPVHMDFYFLDLSAYQYLSEKVSEKLHALHQSSQILLVKDGACIFEESKSEISLQQIMDHIPVVA